MQTDVIVIGGGIAGLACAAELADNGLSAVVLEKSEHCGGRAASWTDTTTGDRVDIGPHILLSEYRNMLRLLERCGTRGDIQWNGRKFITLAGKPRPVQIRMHPLPAPLHFFPSLLSLPQVSLADLASNSRLMWKVMSLSPAATQKLDSMNALEYLRQQGVSSHFIDWFWRSASMSIMNVPLEQCSAGALLRFFRFMIGRSDYQVGFPTTALADLFVPGTSRKISRAGGAVWTQSEVESLNFAEDRFRGVRLKDGRHIESPYCVVAVPPQESHDLISASASQPKAGQKSLALSEYCRRLREFRPSPYISTFLWFDRKLTSETFWARVWSPDNLSYDSYDLSSFRSGWEARPSLIASNAIYSLQGDDLSDEQIVETIRREIAEYLPAAREAEMLHARVHRIPMAIPAPHPGTEQLRLDTRTPMQGLFLAGDWTRTGLPASMESAVRSAYLAAEALLRDERAPAQTQKNIALPLPGVEGFVRLFDYLQ